MQHIARRPFHYVRYQRSTCPDRPVVIGYQDEERARTAPAEWLGRFAATGVSATYLGTALAPIETFDGLIRPNKNRAA